MVKNVYDDDSNDVWFFRVMYGSLVLVIHIVYGHFDNRLRDRVIHRVTFCSSS